MLKNARIGLKVDVDTLRGTREGVPRLMALFKKLRLDATFYFSVGPDHTGRALRRVFRKGFAQKVARTSVLKHYGLKTLLYGVLLPGPDIGRSAGARDAQRARRRIRGGTAHLRSRALAGPRGQGHAGVDPRGIRARPSRPSRRVFGFPPQSHAAAGWQINAARAGLWSRNTACKYASDTRGGPPFLPHAHERRERLSAAAHHPAHLR